VELASKHATRYGGNLYLAPSIDKVAFLGGGND